MASKHDVLEERLHSARVEMRIWFEDLEKLKPHIGFGETEGPDRKPFNDAWDAAIKQAQTAAAKYAAAVLALDED